MQDSSTRGTAFLPLFGGSPTPTFEVARAARRFPVILEWLAAGSVNLTAVRLLAPHLTPQNHRSALESARGKKKVEVEEIVARRTVWVRDLGRCAFLGTSGRRCGERAFVEFHHVRPFAAGGEASVGNIELRCRRHNDYEMRATRTRAFATVSSRASRGDTFRHGALQPGLIPSRRLSSE